MNEQLGWRGFIKNMKKEAPRWAGLMPELPRLVHQALNRDDTELRLRISELEAAQRRGYSIAGDRDGGPRAGISDYEFLTRVSNNRMMRRA